MADEGAGATKRKGTPMPRLWQRAKRVLSPPATGARRAMIGLLPRVSRPLSVALVTVTVLGALLPVCFIVVTGLLVGAIPGAVDGGFHTPEGRRLVVILCATGLVYLLQQVAMTARAMVAGSLGRRVTAHLEHTVMAATMAPPGVGHLEDPAVLDDVRRAQGVGPSQTTGPGGVTPGTAVAGIADQWSRRLQGLAAMAIVAGFRWWLGALLLLGELINLRLYARAYFQYLETATGTTRGLRRAGYFRDLGLGPEAAKEIRIFGLAGWVTQRFEAHWTGAMAEVWAGRRLNAYLQALPLLTQALVSFSAFLVIGHAAIAGDLSLGATVATAQARSEERRVGKECRL